MFLKYFFLKEIDTFQQDRIKLVQTSDSGIMYFWLKNATSETQDENVKIGKRTQIGQ